MSGGVKKQQDALIVALSKDNVDVAVVERVFAAPYHDGSKALMVNSVQEALSIQTPSIAALNKYRGLEYAAAVVAIYVGIANSLLNPTRPMTDIQIKMAANIICADSKFALLTVADISAAVVNGCKGSYGNIYEGLDMMKICAFFDAYLEDKYTVAEANSIARHKTRERQEREEVLMLPPEVRQKLKELVKDLEATNKPLNKIPCFLSLKDYCAFYELDELEKETEFVLKAAKEHVIDESSHVHAIYQFEAYYRSRLNDWLRRINEVNGYKKIGFSKNRYFKQKK